VVLSAILILASFRMLVDSYQVETSTRESVMACNAARQVIENMRTIKDARFTTGTYTDARVFGAVPQLASLSNSSVSMVIATSVGKAKKVSVTVAWTSAVRSRTKNWKLVTLIGPGGISL
jgi:Tfp pilus assembly protein PilV